MNCHARGCFARSSWFRGRLLRRPGYYLQSQWFCSEACLENGVLKKLGTPASSREGTAPFSFQMKLEYVLLGNGLIRREQLAGKDPNMDLTQFLLERDLVKERDITLALSRIHNIPVINLNGRRIHPDVLNTVPAEIVRTHEFFPLEFVAAEKCLVLVTGDPSSLPVMINLRSILECQIEIYISPASVVRSMIEIYCRLSVARKGEEERKEMAGTGNPRDAAGWIVRHAREAGAQSLQVARFGEFIWTRFFVGEEPLNFVL
jgi:hypothetical protein